jgi:hypothetical protein
MCRYQKLASILMTLFSVALPSGFDSERLLVNLRGIDRIRSIAGLGNVSVTSTRGDTSTYGTEITGVDSSGTATYGRKMLTHQTPLASGSVSFPSNFSMVGKADAAIVINSSEAEERAQRKNGPEGLFNPSIRANLLNNALKEGLGQASIDANDDLVKRALSLGYYSWTSILALAMGVEPTIYAAVYGSIAPIANASIVWGIVKGWNKFGVSEADPKETAKHTRFSFTAGVSLDRALISKSMIHTTRLIKSRD